MAAIEEVDVDDFPFGLGARALVRAVAGDMPRRWPTPRRSSRCAGRATSISPSAGSAACWRRSAPVTTLAEARWLERFDTLVASVGDVGFLAVAQRLHGRPDDEATMEAAALAPGWRRIVDSVVVG